jgi:hypothetical protein
MIHTRSGRYTAEKGKIDSGAVKVGFKDMKVIKESFQRN